MSAPPADTADDPVGGCEQRPRANGHGARRVLRTDVERHGAPHVRAVEQALVQHDLGPVVALLARLEHQQDVALEPVSPLDQQARRPEQHRHVRVVPAGVHRAIDLGGEFEAGLLAQGQRVHVGSKQGRAPRSAAFDRRRHRRRPAPQARFQPETAERVDDHGLRLGQLQPDLGAAVDPPAHVDDVGEDRLGGG